MGPVTKESLVHGFSRIDEKAFILSRLYKKHTKQFVHSSEIIPLTVDFSRGAERPCKQCDCCKNHANPLSKMEPTFGECWGEFDN